MPANIHASCVQLGKAGTVFDAPEAAAILLLGPSGSGKSDLALRLIAMGAALVADDRTQLIVEKDALIASPVAKLAGLIEVRNLGILALPYRARAQIALAVDLDPGRPPERLPEPERWPGPAGLGLAGTASPPLIRLNAFEVSAPVKIALAAAAFTKSLLRETIAAN